MQSKHVTLEGHKVHYWEGGAGFTHTTERLALIARAAYFHTHVDRDLIFSETAGRNTLAHGTTRDGQVLDVRLPRASTPVRFVRVVTRRSPSWVAWKEIRVT